MKGTRMYQTIDYETWHEFKAKIFNVLFDGTLIKRGKYLFRGQRSPDWKLASTFDRSFSSIKGKDRAKLEKELLEHFAQECESESQLKEILSDNIAKMALAQHYGLPTRLLDWTESPYIAAFFAFQHAVSAYSKTIEDFQPNDKIAIWAIDSDHHIWSENNGVQIVSPKTWDNDRMRNQFGKFTLSKTPFRSLQEYVENCEESEGALLLIRLPHNQAQIALADLDLMGINNTTMFADLEGKAMSAITKVVLGARTRYYQGS